MKGKHRELGSVVYESLFPLPLTFTIQASSEFFKNLLIHLLEGQSGTDKAKQKAIFHPLTHSQRAASSKAKTRDSIQVTSMGNKDPRT